MKQKCRNVKSRFLHNVNILKHLSIRAPVFLSSLKLVGTGVYTSCYRIIDRIHLVFYASSNIYLFFLHMGNRHIVKLSRPYKGWVCTLLSICLSENLQKYQA